MLYRCPCSLATNKTKSDRAKETQVNGTLFGNGISRTIFELEISLIWPDLVTAYVETMSLVTASDLYSLRF